MTTTSLNNSLISCSFIQSFLVIFTRKIRRSGKSRMWKSAGWLGTDHTTHLFWNISGLDRKLRNRRFQQLKKVHLSDMTGKLNEGLMLIKTPIFPVGKIIRAWHFNHASLPKRNHDLHVVLIPSKFREKIVKILVDWCFFHDKAIHICNSNISFPKIYAYHLQRFGFDSMIFILAGKLYIVD